MTDGRCRRGPTAPTRDAIIAFVESVASGPDAVPDRAERVAVFDNDGTLWTEKPMPTQLHYIVQQWAQQRRPTRRSPSGSRTRPPSPVTSRGSAPRSTSTTRATTPTSRS